MIVVRGVGEEEDKEVEEGFGEKSVKEVRQASFSIVHRRMTTRLGRGSQTTRKI